MSIIQKALALAVVTIAIAIASRFEWIDQSIASALVLIVPALGYSILLVRERPRCETTRA